MTTEYIAVKHPTSKFGEWCIAPKDVFVTHGYIPDGHLNLDIPGMEEVSDHTYVSRDLGNGRQWLIASGIEIIDVPQWYFERPGYAANCD